MRTLIATATLLLCCHVAGCNRTDSKLKFSAHTKTPLPKSAKLIQSGAQYAGFDASYGFMFEVEDDALLNQLVEEWNLESAPESGSGFFKFAKLCWWPTDEKLAKMEPSLGRENKEDEEYWHVWCDKSNGKLYVEHGRW